MFAPQRRTDYHRSFQQEARISQCEIADFRVAQFLCRW